MLGPYNFANCLVGVLFVEHYQDCDKKGWKENFQEMGKNTFFVLLLNEKRMVTGEFKTSQTQSKDTSNKNKNKI